jgi:cytosine/adenosine deaminase-related metal-dependent hydrolase
MTEAPVSDDRVVLYCSSWVLPVSQPPIADGAVAVRGERIVAVGTAAELHSAHPDAVVEELGQCIVMPGFVNAHSHLEYATFRGIMDDTEFGDWIIRLVDVKASLTPDEYLQSARLGAAECLSSGITTIADTSYSGVTLQAAAEAGLRGRLYLEVFGIDDTRLDETLADLEGRLALARAAAPPRFDIGIAPHAPYTVSSRLYQAIAAYSRAHDVKVASHVAESKEELTYIRSGSGKFAHDYREKMGWERMLVQPYGVSPIKYLQQWGVFDENFLAVHCVHASADDVAILRAKKAAVAHCPKSNAKLGCGVAPLADLLHAGVRVGFGTDSPASSTIMDMFDEMRTALLLHRAVERDVSVLDAALCIRIATLGGAEALGLERDIGSLEPGKYADLIAVDLSSSHFAPIGNPYSALVYGANQDDVVLTCIGGDVVYRDRAFTQLDAEAIRRASYAVRAKLHERVREGAIPVGAAESGWWHPAVAKVEEKEA